VTNGAGASRSRESRQHDETPISASLGEIRACAPILLMATQYGYSAVLATDLHSAVYGSYKLRNEPLVLLMIAIIFYHTLISAAFFADWTLRSFR
jgi:hypothetical protein